MNYNNGNYRNNDPFSYGGQQPAGGMQYPQGDPFGNPDMGRNYVNHAAAASGSGGARKVLIAVIIALGVVLIGLVAVVAIELVHTRGSADADTTEAEVSAAAEMPETEGGGSAAAVTEEAAEPEAEPETEEYDFSALVVDALYEDKNFTSETYNFAIPMIDWEGGDVQDINDEIFDRYDPVVEDVMALGSDRMYEAQSGGIWYSWFMNDDILTIIVYNYVYPDASGWDEPDIWSVDFRDPEDPVRMSSDDVLEYFGISEDEMVSTAQAVLGNAFCSTYEAAFDNGMDPYDSFTQQQFSRSMEQGNAETAIPFVGENGNLWIKGTVYSIVAGDSYPQLLDMEDYEISHYYTEFMGG